MNDSDLLKAMHSSLAITFGTDAPYTIGHIEAERIGYADIPTVVCRVICRDEDLPALVPITRQRVYRELAERGWTPDDIAFTPSTQRGRRRKFTDSNESSETVGRDKYGNEYRFSFEMGRELARVAFEKRNRFAPLPQHPSRAGAS